MWSLPDISHRLNSEATSNKRKLERAIRTGKLDGEPLTCEHADDHCSGPVTGELYFDIFSDDPKGILAQCEHHRDEYGTPEGYFYCGDCERTMITNYTWELYSTTVDDEELCLPCAAARYIAEPQNWITLTADDIAAVDVDRIRQAGHVIGVSMPVPKEIHFFHNVEFDSSTGGRLRSTMSADATPTMGVMELQAYLLDALNEGYTRALLILDAGYQFSVSIGIYLDANEYAAKHPETMTKSQRKEVHRRQAATA